MRRTSFFGLLLVLLAFSCDSTPAEEAELPDAVPPGRFVLVVDGRERIEGNAFFNENLTTLDPPAQDVTLVALLGAADSRQNAYLGRLGGVPDQGTYSAADLPNTVAGRSSSSRPIR